MFRNVKLRVQFSLYTLRRYGIEWRYSWTHS